jgi:cell division transport system permease protein
MSLRIGIREGLRTISRNGSLFILSLLVTSISLFLLSLFALITVNLYHFLDILDQKIEIITFLNENVDHKQLQENIKKINGVTDVVYVSSEEALRDLQAEIQETEEVLSVFEANPLPASLRIKLESRFRNAQGLQEISAKIMLMRGVTETIYGGELVGELKKITHIVTMFDLGLLAIIIFSVIFVIFQTIKLTIFARATEIEIMKLVGASNSFIAVPFTFEGIIQGILGGLIAFILTIITARAASSFITDIFYPQWLFLLGSVVSGMFFGIIGSTIALRRFLQ